MSLNRVLNSAWQIKVKGRQTENKTANIQMSRTTFIPGSVRLLPQYLLPLLQLRFCSAGQLGLSLWPWDLDKPQWSWRQCRLFHSSKTLLVEGAERLNSFQNQCEGLQRRFVDPIFIQSFRPLRRHSTWGKSFSMLFITDLNHTMSIVERSLTTTILHISSASVMLDRRQILSKYTSQRVYQILV